MSESTLPFRVTASSSLHGRRYILEPGRTIYANSCKANTRDNEHRPNHGTYRKCFSQINSITEQDINKEQVLGDLF